MAEQRGGGGRAGAGDAGGGFVDRIVKDPKNPPKTLLLVGYLGRSSDEGYTRLYLDPELNDYVEIPNAAILHSEPSGEDSPLAGSYVWITRGTEVVHGEAGGARYRAGFLEGRISQDFMGQAAGVGGATAALPFPTIPFWLCNTRFPPFCPSIPWWRCPTRFFPLCRSILIVHCPSLYLPYCRPSIPRFTCPVSFVVICPSVAVRCPPSQLTVCPSVAVRCPTLPGTGCPQPSALTQCPTIAGCPSAVDACPSAPGGCTIDPTIFQGTTVINPGIGMAGGLADAGQFGMDPTGGAAGWGFGAGYGGYGFGG